MPATYTHHTFAKDFYGLLNSDIKNKLDENTLLVFTQSFDILFFYDYALGSFAHRNYVNDYFRNILVTMKENDFYENEQAMSYLYGSLCHYLLDSIAHPFIFYKTGVYQKNDKSTYQYQYQHTKMEAMLDAIIYEERNHRSIKHASLGNEVLPKIKFDDFLSQLLNEVFKKTFQREQASLLFKKGLINYRFIVKHVFVSQFGIKYYFTYLLAKMHIPIFAKYLNYLYYINELDYSYLNLNHDEWCYPVDDEKTSQYSFYDLYDISLKKAIELSEDIYNYFYGTMNIESVLEKIGNNNYATGVDSARKLTMKYFEF